MVSSADHTSILLFGRRAAPTGTSGNPMIEPHWPTTEGSVLRLAPLMALFMVGACTWGAPRRDIPATPTEDPEPAADDSAVSLTKRVVTGWIPMCFVSVVFAQVPDAASVKCTPSALTLTLNRPIAPVLTSCAGWYATPDTVCG